MSLFDERIIIQTPAWRTDRGSTWADWSAPTSRVVDGAEVQPGASDEDLNGRDATLVRYTALLPGWDGGLANTRFKLPETEPEKFFQVIGEPERWVLPGSEEHYLRVFLQDWTEGRP